MSLTLSILPQSLAVARLAPSEGVPAWLDWSDPFVAVTRTEDEISAVCDAARVPETATAERGWRAFKVHGPLDFALTGVLASLAAPLAAARVGVFALSTYDTDYLLVREHDLETAVGALSTSCRIIRDQAA